MQNKGTLVVAIKLCKTLWQQLTHKSQLKEKKLDLVEKLMAFAQKK